MRMKRPGLQGSSWRHHWRFDVRGVPKRIPCGDSRRPCGGFSARLIGVLDLESGEPITTEQVRYGFRVSVVMLPVMRSVAPLRASQSSVRSTSGTNTSTSHPKTQQTALKLLWCEMLVGALRKTFVLVWRHGVLQ